MSIFIKLQKKEHSLRLCVEPSSSSLAEDPHLKEDPCFTKLNADEFEDMVTEKGPIMDGCAVHHGQLWGQIHPSSDPLSK